MTRVKNSFSKAEFKAFKMLIFEGKMYKKRWAKIQKIFPDESCTTDFLGENDAPSHCST